MKGHTVSASQLSLHRLARPAHPHTPPPPQPKPKAHALTCEEKSLAAPAKNRKQSAQSHHLAQASVCMTLACLQVARTSFRQRPKECPGEPQRKDCSKVMPRRIRSLLPAHRCLVEAGCRDLWWRFSRSPSRDLLNSFALACSGVHSCRYC